MGAAGADGFDVGWYATDGPTRCAERRAWCRHRGSEPMLDAGFLLDGFRAGGISVRGRCAYTARNDNIIYYMACDCNCDHVCHALVQVPRYCVSAIIMQS